MSIGQLRPQLDCTTEAVHCRVESARSTRENSRQIPSIEIVCISLKYLRISKFGGLKLSGLMTI